MDSSNDCFVAGTYIKARQGLNGFLADSNYETDAELGRGRRRKKLRAVSSDEEEEPLKKTTKVIPAPPVVVRSSGQLSSNQSKGAKSRVARNQEADHLKRKVLKEVVTHAVASAQQKISLAKRVSENSVAGEMILLLLFPSSLFLVLLF